MILPLTNSPEEEFSSSIFGVVYNFRQLWNEYGFWTLDIKNADDTVLAYGIKIVTQEDILKQYPHIPFELSSSKDDDPERYTLDTFNLEVTEK